MVTIFEASLSMSKDRYKLEQIVNKLRQTYREA